MSETKKKPYVPSLYPDNPKTAKFKQMSNDSIRRILLTKYGKN